jgi:hypothetical protein
MKSLKKNTTREILGLLLSFSALATGCAGAGARTQASVTAQPAAGTQTVDIGANCLRDRYAIQGRCDDNHLSDCQSAAKSAVCGIPYGATINSSSCVDVGGNFQYHSVCVINLPPPLPQPQCPNDHVLGTAGSDCQGSCTKNCAKMCIGGYCTDGAYNTCYDYTTPMCDCGRSSCPCTGPDCN